MSVYSITYFLNDNHHNESENLSGKIRSLGSWAQIMPSVWTVNTEMCSNEITESLKEVLNEKDLLLVSKITEDTSGILHPRALSWITDRLK